MHETAWTDVPTPVYIDVPSYLFFINIKSYTKYRKRKRKTSHSTDKTSTELMSQLLK